MGKSSAVQQNDEETTCAAERQHEVLEDLSANNTSGDGSYASEKTDDSCSDGESSNTG